MTELYRLNNNIRTRGIFRRSDPLQVQFLYTIEDPDKRYLEYLPAFDWNRVDGFMIGAAIHNGTMIPKRVKYFMMPFYSFRKNGITGYGNISLNITPYNYFIRLATFTLEGSQFGAPGNQNYHKIKIGLDLTLKSDLFDKSVKQNLFGYYYSASDLNQIEALEPAAILSYMQCGYLIERFGIINPYKIAVSLESGKAYIKTSLEINYRYSYTGKNSGLDIRIFSGIMVRNNLSDPIYAFSAGARSGPELYLYQGVYPDRFSRFPANFWSRQMTFSEGGLVSSVSDSLGYGNWLCSVSLTSNFPGKASTIPVKPFVNLSLNDFSTRNHPKAMFSFEAGFKAGIWDFFEIYIPLVVSGNIDVLTGSFRNRIRFIFRLDRLTVPRFKS